MVAGVDDGKSVVVHIDDPVVAVEGAGVETEIFKSLLSMLEVFRLKLYSTKYITGIG